MERQKTVAGEVSFSGIGVHTGNLTTITFKPAPANSGITFYRVDLPGRPGVKADVDHVVEVARGTTISENGVRVHTVEHVMAACVGLGIDNLDIEIDANETPFGDGSSMPFLSVLKRAGLVEQDAPKRYIEIKRPVYYKSGDVTLSVFPADELRVTMTISYEHPAVGTQYNSFQITPDSFEKEVASARTFCFLREVKMLQDQNLIKGGSLENAVVIGDESILNEELRYPDEFVRHKILDLLGDTYLLGGPIKGHFIGMKSGHASHVEFSRQIRQALANGRSKGYSPAAVAGSRNGNGNGTTGEPAFDVNAIMGIIPHRFPFLLVDRILAFVPNESVVGIKNVTVNEPFFQGHWPNLPVMPAVLIMEVMAQVSSPLLFDGSPDSRKYPFFLGIDKARFRRTVVPGDQIVVEAELVHRRRNAIKVKALAKIDGVIAAEAEMLFGIREVAETETAPIVYSL